jgi:putative membrane protein
MKRTKFAIALSVSALLLTAVGCTSPSDQSNSQTQSASPTDQTAASPTASASSGSPVAQATTEPDRNATNSEDSPFMMAAAQGGMSEVALAQLAQQRASSDRVKQFAQRMLQDHGQANSKLMQIFQQKSVTAPETVGAQYGAMREQLEDLSGADFDREYMSQMVEDHTEDVANFQREVDNGKDQDVRAWASQTLPTLKEHLQLAKTVNQSLTGSTTP